MPRLRGDLCQCMHNPVQSHEFFHGSASSMRRMTKLWHISVALSNGAGLAMALSLLLTFLSDRTAGMETWLRCDLSAKLQVRKYCSAMLDHGQCTLVRAALDGPVWRALHWRRMYSPYVMGHNRDVGGAPGSLVGTRRFCVRWEVS